MTMPYRALGALPDRFDPRDRIFEAAMGAFLGATPTTIDLRNLCSPVRDQGQQGSCTGFAMGALREFLENKTGKPKAMQIVSPAYIYYHERKLEGSVADCQAGAYPRDGLKVLKSLGVCPEADAPYSDTTCGAPSATAETHATALKIKSYQRITTLNGLKTAVANGNACVIGITVYESFESKAAQTTGHIPMPGPHEALLGGHALLCCGYKDSTKYAGGGYLIVKNSWGTAFGDKGYIYLPYGYAIPSLMSDIWTATA
jgi:C1A family cysteine protease